MIVILVFFVISTQPVYFVLL